MAVSLLGTVFASALAGAATFTVNSVGDLGDDDLTDGVCSTGQTLIVSSNPVIFLSECTLRAAIEQANDDATLDTVEFGWLLPTTAGFVEISPATALPPIVQPIMIDGYSHPAYDDTNPNPIPIVNLVGAGTGAGGSTDGLVLSTGADRSVVRGLAISQFPDAGLRISSSFPSPAGPTDVVIQGNHIGSWRSKIYVGNGGDGIRVSHSSGNTIGQLCTKLEGCSGVGNVIAASEENGIEFSGSSGGNTVAGNLIGVDRFGTSTIGPGGGTTGNKQWGVRIFLGSENSVIGGSGFTSSAGQLSPVASGNTISGNLSGGVLVDAFNTRIYGNQIGTNAAGSSALPNVGPGIWLREAREAQVGLEGPLRNIISGNTASGIDIASTSSIGAIVGNRIGVDSSGTSPLGNGESGIVNRGSDYRVESNEIGANSEFGVQDFGTSTRLYSNFIGTNPYGNNLGNGISGVQVDGIDLIVGDVGQGNVIGFHPEAGIEIEWEGEYSLIASNYIGTNPAGDDLGNEVGIESQRTCCHADGRKIGGRDGRINGLANVIGHNDSHGISLGGPTEILGNFIGTNAADEDLGNGGNGIRFQFANGNSDGSPGSNIGAAIVTDPSDVPRDGNTIAFNAGNGIFAQEITQVSFRGNEFRNNGEIAIDLAGFMRFGLSPNDPDDADESFDPQTPEGHANRFMNNPEFTTNLTSYDEVTGELIVAYMVDTAIENATYPLTVDFYRYDPWRIPGDQVGEYLGRDLYTASNAQSLRIAAITPLPGTMGENDLGFVFGGLRATVTDATGSTSEVSFQNVPVPEPEGGLVMGAAALIGAAAWSRARPQSEHGRTGAAL